MFFGLVFFGLMGRLPDVNANDIQVSNVSLNKDTGGAYWEVSFDITWQNSWRTDNLNGDGATNWDAVWLFVKYYNVDNGTWGHVYLTSDGHSAGSGTVAELAPGKVNENKVYDPTDNPFVGAMLYRSENGSGTFSASGVTLRWDYESSGLSAGSEVLAKTHAIEMVYIAPGPFYVGTGGSEVHAFYAAATDKNPFLVTDEWDGCVADAEGCLWATGSIATSSDYLGGQALTPDYPRGTEGFSIMKYEISQQQYADFLNTLTPAQASARASTAITTGGNRQGIREVYGTYITSTSHVAANRLSWLDGAAYLDWAGLRPMTELEYEKAARGFSGPVANEYAWGTTNIESTGGSGNYNNLGDATETMSQGNAVFSGSNPGGPARVGIFAGEVSNRESSGAGAWGVMELSGNLWEQVISTGTTAGRSFRGYHGDGQLTVQGIGDAITWPVIGEFGIIGTGFRGGGWSSEDGDLRTSDRRQGGLSNSSQFSDNGFRGVRSVQDDGLYELAVVIIGEGSVTKVPDLESYEPGTQVELTAVPLEGFRFVIWMGDVDGTNESAIITINKNKTIVVQFNSTTEVVDVVNPVTGVTWMDRNLGASRVATNSTDAEAYGDLYQWGRSADGHEKRNSSTRSTLSSSDQPGHGDFITGSLDWRSPQNDNLWQGVDGVNNPCPVGYRLPTEAEWNAERSSWSSNNSAGAYGSPLKLPVAGYRSLDDGSLVLVGSYGNYWSSTVDGTRARNLYFRSSNAIMDSDFRARGFSVRCCKD